MHLTRFTDYSLRVLMYLAESGSERTTIAEIASRFEVSRNHLMKVVQELSRLGYVSAVRGKHGGLSLKQAPGSIHLGALVRDTEHSLALVECEGDDSACYIAPICRFKQIANEGLTAFLEVLDRYTLDDLMTPQCRQRLHTLKLIELEPEPEAEPA
ncbi:MULTISPECIES: Rrf2 family transcriptional regulator [unclassified Halomonas]|uniref:Rrf2 family transcriptional regulator n=1 Tax=Halomonas sp. H10-59 TaxID=2950874 RepID=A0AAU7KTC0_9GAMM|nr:MULTISPECIES: Rrf2 family transcriptional regulator [unclassified Halomonas]MBR9773168.1 Rrf2 family transcriptional regulator [Gammaproteobacteria bacterium]MBS8270805.1 Rrf2 family transcriptional regulator [Halomonas litopenaei]KJZ10573.1 Rrf2 family transcriptional regulator [Halomonas sp. S2151]MAR70621.1 Rrf2 family transcriptional regulator [Halomonas sp.]MBY6110986.1 Rrf2 family transcriptional regulator [Halomonas sp. DP1Y21-3]|tara:strand:+ start:455 stop:922 length:468 start_codon:yes stop_codon:yes gene_type:complete